MTLRMGVVHKGLFGQLPWLRHSYLLRQASSKHSYVTCHCIVRTLHHNNNDTCIKNKLSAVRIPSIHGRGSSAGVLSVNGPLLGRSGFHPCLALSSLHSQQIRHASQDGYYKYLSSDSTPVGWAQQCLEWIHTTSGLPWWATIVLTTAALRTVITLPCTIYSFSILAKVERLQPEVMELTKELKGEVASAMKKYGWDDTIARRHYDQNMKRLIEELHVRNNCHPLKSTLIFFIQIPLWISLSLALRNMAGALPVAGAAHTVLCPEMGQEGILWFTNLLVADSTMILPVSMALLNLAIVEMNALRSTELSRTAKVLTNLFRGFSLCMIPIAAYVPSCMALYWTTSSFYGLAQNIVLRLPSVRRTLGIPKKPSESSTPFQDMYTVAKQKYGRKKNEQS